MSHSQEVQPIPPSVLAVESVSETESLSETTESAFVALLLAEDFQRIGIQPRETRSAVIRRAASRTSKSLARRQLSAPSRATEEQLSQVATSTYRLLDPRQRIGDHDRAHVGRIRPGTLLNIERYGFAGKVASDSDSFSATDSNHDQTESGQSKRFTSPLSKLDLRGVGVSAVSPDSTTTTVGQSVFSEYPSRRPRIAWLRNRLHQPPFLIALVVVVAMTAVALWAGIGFPGP